MDGVEIEVVGGLVEQQSRRLAEERLRQQHAHLLAALQLAHLALVERLGNVQAVEQHGGVALGRVAVLVADGAFELAQPHAVFIGHFRLGVDAVALLERRPQRLVAHDDRVDDAIGVESELILAQHAEFARAHDRALLRLQLAGQDLHEGGFSGAIRPGEAVAAARSERCADVFKEELGAVAHGDIADADHLFDFLMFSRSPSSAAARQWPRGPVEVDFEVGLGHSKPPRNGCSLPLF